MTTSGNIEVVHESPRIHPFGGENSGMMQEVRKMATVTFRRCWR